MIFAEKRREDSGDGHYTLRYLVWNGEVLGTYGVQYGNTEYDSTGWNINRLPQDPVGGGFAYGASRDYHRLATAEQIAARKAWDDFYALSEEEQEKIWDTDAEPDYAQTVDECCYLDNQPACCDGSSLVEVITDNDRRCFEIAAMMADIERLPCPDCTDCPTGPDGCQSCGNKENK